MSVLEQGGSVYKPNIATFKDPDGFTTNIISTDRLDSVAYIKSSGVRTPHFRERLHRGELIPFTPWDQVFEQGSVLSGYYFTVDPAGYTAEVPWFNGYRDGSESEALGDFRVDIPSLIAAYPLDPRDLLQSAASRIATKGYDALTALGELKETVEMYSTTVHRLKNFTTKAIGKFKPFHRLEQRVELLNNLWLEARYGWRILFKDTNDLSAALNHFNKARTRYTARPQDVAHVSNKTIHESDSEAHVAYTVVEDQIVYGARGCITADIKPPQFAFDPLATAYELIPYSFVVDWVVNIHDMLQTLAFLRMNREYTASEGRSITFTRNWHVDVDFKPGYSGQVTSIGKYVAEWVNRNPRTIPLTPSVSTNVTGLHIADAFALTYQRLGPELYARLRGRKVTKAVARQLLLQRR
jgi:hypothetical protein